MRYFVSVMKPLYPKVYLEAFKLKRYINTFLLKGPLPLSKGSDVLLRTFLTSSRSFKDSIIKKPDFNAKLRLIIRGTPMPKFIWVTELSDKTLMKQGLANGLIIIDATEPNTENERLMILAAYQSKLVYFNEKSAITTNYPLLLQAFSIYHNLR